MRAPGQQTKGRALVVALRATEPTRTDTPILIFAGIARGPRKNRRTSARIVFPVQIRMGLIFDASLFIPGEPNRLEITGKGFNSQKEIAASRHKIFGGLSKRRTFRSK